MGVDNFNNDSVLEFTEVEIDLNKIRFINDEIDINDQDTKEIFDTFKESNCKRLVIIKYAGIYHVGFTETEINIIRSIIDKIFVYMSINYHIDNLSKIKRYFEYQLLGDKVFDDNDYDNFIISYFNNKIYRVYEYVEDDILFDIGESDSDIDFHITQID